MNIPTNYAQNPQSMLQYEYKSVYFVCRKPKFPLAIAPSTSENEIHENGLNFSVDEEDNTIECSNDIDNHDPDDTN